MKGIIGTNFMNKKSTYECKKCNHRFQEKSTHDQIQCPQCGSSDVKSVFGMREAIRQVGVINPLR
ncbi:zinc ribbon domain-containing protein [Desulfurispirillum indicum]|uniref:FmdB family zinc ribbon protein n=1 Tax=Desulfurispirillum indicum TaxID=936456 RepID=UPI001CFBF209|nr:zinc ribbon domain-containing protein [Desulfurispirillum indicum]UCZ57129.1 zinc ribbon domain-containing protein [Desulfurispirillum indicum]